MFFQAYEHEKIKEPTTASNRADFFRTLNGDERPRHLRYSIMCIVELRHLFKMTEMLNAKSAITKAKSTVSPYFGANSFAFAYATV